MDMKGIIGSVQKRQKMSLSDRFTVIEELSVKSPPTKQKVVRTMLSEEEPVRRRSSATGPQSYRSPIGSSRAQNFSEKMAAVARRGRKQYSDEDTDSDPEMFQTSPVRRNPKGSRERRSSVTFLQRSPRGNASRSPATRRGFRSAVFNRTRPAFTNLRDKAVLRLQKRSVKQRLGTRDARNGGKTTSRTDSRRAPLKKSVKARISFKKSPVGKRLSTSSTSGRRTSIAGRLGSTPKAAAGGSGKKFPSKKGTPGKKTPREKPSKEGLDGDLESYMSASKN